MTRSSSVRVLPDVQNRPDDRGVILDQVGVESIRYPVMILDQSGALHRTVATVSMSVSLAHEIKGTHMSRFIEILHSFSGELTPQRLPLMLETMRDRLMSKSAKVSISFPYFLRRVAPVSAAVAYVDYDCALTAELDDSGMRLEVLVNVPVTSLCPCSKEISDYGAHNQRGIVTIAVESSGDAKSGAPIIWIEELVALAESGASAPVYSLLKRSDERHVTMQAYENPVFVEDIVRTVASALKQDARIAAFRVKAANQESIHNHDAFAQVDWQRKP